MSTTGIRPQLFGTKKSADTRKAQRFFAERRVPVHFVDLAEKGASLGELRRFAQKHGVQALLDRDSKRFAELGLRSAMYGDERWLTLLVDEPLLLRQPLVRIGPWVGIGVDETGWKEALAKGA
jgi:arsenate reductase